MNKKLFANITPHIVAFLTFIIISFAYFTPQLSGKKVAGHDTKTFLGTSKEIYDYRDKTGGEILWTNSIFGGMPGYLISPPKVRNVISVVHKFISSFGRPASFLMFYLLGFYIALLLFKVNPYLSIVGAIAYAFSSYFFIIVDVGHNTKAIALGYMPPIIAGIYNAYYDRKWLGAIIAAIFLSLQMYVNHLQITYYTFFTILIVGIFVGYDQIKNKKLNHFLQVSGIIIGLSLLAVATNISRLYLTYEYGKFSTRSKSELTYEQDDKTGGLDKSYITASSYGKMETFTLLIPNLYGGGSSDGKLPNKSETIKLYEQGQGGKARAQKLRQQQFPMYWGDQPGHAGPVYVGAIVVLLFVLGMFILKGNLKWLLLIATLFSFALSWGRNLQWFTNIFIHYFPGYDKFRSVNMALVIAEFTMPLTAILTVREIILNKIPPKKLLEKLKYSLYIVGGLCLVFYLFASSIFDFAGVNDAYYGEMYAGKQSDIIIDAWRADRLTLLKNDAIRSLVFVLIGSGLIWLLVKEKLKISAFIAILGLAILIDMWPVAKRYLNNDKFVDGKVMKTPFPKTKADNYILQDKDPDYRVLNLSVDLFNDASTAFYHKSLGGYHAAKMKKYQELIEYHISDEIQTMASGLRSQSSNIDSVFEQLPVLNMFNTKYIIFNGDAMPLLNEERYGNAWFVEKIKKVDNADQEIAGLYNPNAIEKLEPLIREKVGYKTELTRLSKEVNTPENEQRKRALSQQIAFTDAKINRLKEPLIDQIALVDKRYEDEIAKSDFTVDSSDIITLESYSPDYMVYKSKASTDQVAVFSEVYYDKGWNAYIDGEPVDHFRADYILRAMNVPAGEHTIEFKFEPKSYYITNKITLTSSIVLLLIFIAVIYVQIKESTGKEEKEEETVNT